MTPRLPLWLSHHVPEIFHLMFLDGVVGHFEYSALAELAVTFERYIGAKFCPKWFTLSHQSRKKVGKEWSRNQNKKPACNRKH